MKRNISDLFDSLDYSPLKTRTADIVSAERIKELTMDAITNKTASKRGTTWRKGLTAILAAAVLILALCGAAYAANISGIRDHFRELFAGADTEISKSDLETLENIGAEEMPSVTSGGTTMTVTAAVYEGSSYYLALEIVAPEDTVLDRGESFWQLWGDHGDWPKEGLLLESADGRTFDLNISTMFSDDTPGDNEITVIVEFMMDGAEADGLSFGDGSAKYLQISGLWLQSPDKEYTKILGGEWMFDLERIGVSGRIPSAANEPGIIPAPVGEDDPELPTPMRG